MTKDNIILLGFMASGKSHIGKMLAKKLGFSLLDTDSLIEEEQGISIKDIFAQKGESHFRKLEAKVIKNLSNAKNSIIVAGGGAPIFFENSQVLKALGPNFYLDIGFEMILRRLKNSDRRPLGQVDTPEDLSKLKELYTFRRPIYMNLGHNIDVASENRERACDEIITRYQALKELSHLKTLNIEHPHHRYQILFASIENIQNILLSLGLDNHRPVIITSDHLTRVLQEPLKIIGSKLKDAAILTMKDGEQYKNLSSINQLHEKMFALNLTRKTVVLAIGGGNVGDVAGFASAIYLRGLPFIQIPTSLLAMVDSSIGGKTGVDLDFGKNLVGSFYPPKAVLIDKTFLKTLPREEFSCGMAEVIKHAIIADPSLFFKLKESFDEETIEQALKVKAGIVFSDPYEQNIRAHLNLGHTFAHAIEKVSDYKIKHGFAVAMGLVMATKMALKLSTLEENFLADLEELLQKYGLPIKMPEDISIKELVLAMKHDKKRDNLGLKLILPKRLGQVCIKSVDENDF